MTTNQPYSKTTYLVLCGLFAALTAVCSYITIPLPFTPIPLNLGTLGVFLAGGLLGKKYGTLSTVVYILTGAAGMPVFAGFQAGLGVLAGPTGGFISGYIVAAFLIGFIIYDLPKRAAATASPAKRVKLTALCIGAMTLGTAVCYTFGTIWFMLLMDIDLGAALAACVIPFIPGDILKILVAAFLIQKLRLLVKI